MEWSAEDSAALDAAVFEQGFCHRLEKSGSKSHFAQQVQDAVVRLGFTDFCFLRMEGVGDMAGRLMSLPTSMLQTYHDNIYYEQDYAWQCLQCRDEPMYCSPIYRWAMEAPFETADINRNRAIYQLFKGYGYHDGYCIPLSSVAGDKKRAVFSIFARDMPVIRFQDRVEENEATLRLLGRGIDFVTATRFPEYFKGNRASRSVPMTEASLQVLSVMTNKDLTIRQTAEELSVSLDTVARHLIAIKREFGVRTLERAVSLAMQKGLIKITRMGR